MESVLPEEVRGFIAQHIASLEELEVLLLLHDHPERDWSPAEINEVLRSQEGSIAAWLEALVASGLAATHAGRYRLSPRDDATAHGISAVAEAYRSRRTKVIEFMFSRSNESLLNFVRAFDLRKKP